MSAALIKLLPTLTLPTPSNYFFPDDTSCQVQAIPSKRDAFKKIYKRNRKLYSKIESVLDFVKSITETGVSSNLEQSNSHKVDESTEVLEELNPGCFRIRLSALSITLKPKSSIKCEVSTDCFNEHAIAKRQVLREIALWNMKSNNNMCVIRALENYKTVVRKIVKSESREDPYTRFFQGLRHLKDEVEIAKYKIPPYFSWTSKKGHQMPLYQDQTTLQKEYVRSLGGKESPWFQFEYFSDISKSIVTDFEKIIDQTTITNNVLLLSMYSVNRLAAIAKMRNYCREFKIDLKQFQQGRIKQKIIALETQRKSFLTEQKVFYNKMFSNIDEYPRISELEYLLNLDVSNLDTIISDLKAQLECTSSDYEYQLKEQLFSTYQELNNKLRKKLIHKLLAEKHLDNSAISDQIILEYEKIIPKMVKKRGKELFGENKELKRIKYDEAPITAKSCTGQSEDSVKNSYKNLKKVFKIIHLEKGRPEPIFRLFNIGKEIDCDAKTN